MDRHPAELRRGAARAGRGSGVGSAPEEIGSDGQWLVWLLPVLVVGLFALRGMYRGDLQVRVVEGLGTIVASTSLAAASLIAAAAFTRPVG